MPFITILVIKIPPPPKGGIFLGKILVFNKYNENKGGK